MASVEQKEKLTGEGTDSFAARSKLLAKVLDVIRDTSTRSCSLELPPTLAVRYSRRELVGN